MKETKQMVFSQQVTLTNKRQFDLLRPHTQSARQSSINIVSKSDIDKMRDYLMNDCGFKCKDLSQHNIVRVYNEILEYQKTGTIPQYLINDH